MSQIQEYNLLQACLRKDIAIKWLGEDARDDFFQDPLRFADLVARADQFIGRTNHRFLQIDTIQSIRDETPKANGMLREAVWLNPTHRILYLAILRHFLARLDPLLPAGVYSFRVDANDDVDAYPFKKRMERWKHFHNDFREAALDKNAGAVLITDLASFFDHISCDKLCDTIVGLIGNSADDTDRAVLDLLRRMLNLWSPDGYGIPQNYDPSSFFGSLYLLPVDKQMVASRFTYFRWLDDIRVVTRSPKQALRALHELQRLLATHRLFLAADKTRIISRTDPEYNKLMDVKDDVLLSDSEEHIRLGNCTELKALVPRLLERLQFHESKAGDDRKFRAFSNRLRDASTFQGLRKEIAPTLRELVLPRLASHPSRSDYWTKLLAVTHDGTVTAALVTHLAEDPSIFNWQRFHLWRLALHLASPVPPELLEEANEAALSPISDLVAGQAILFLGRHGDHTERQQLFAKHFTSQRSYPIQRAVLIAIQELPAEIRKRLFERAAVQNSAHQELIDHLQGLTAPEYGLIELQSRKCAEAPKAIVDDIQRGVGLVDGKLVRYRLSIGDLEYE